MRTSTIFIYTKKLKLRVPLVILVVLSTCFYSKAQTDEKAIKQTITNFLYWYKNSKKTKGNNNYAVVKDISINKQLKRQVIDKIRVEKRVDFFRKSNYLSKTYLDNLRRYYYKVGKYLDKSSPLPKNDIVKIDGLDQDIVLDTYEPEVIFDDIAQATITKSLIVYRKALVSIKFANEVNLEIALTKTGGKWLIDHLGPDNKSLNSFFRQ